MKKSADRNPRENVLDITDKLNGAPKIAVIGYGYVGKASSELLTHKYNIDVYEPNEASRISDNEKIDFITRKQQQKNHYDFAVVCTPTPMKENGDCDTSYVHDAIDNTNADLFMIKSTVEPQTTDKLIMKTAKRIIFSPEYVGESRYHNPYFPEKMIETPFWILGGNKEDTTKALDYLLPILGPAKQYMQMSALEAELIKYMENTFFATKITYCQEMFDICEAVGADWNTVREGWLLDPRINPMHTAVFRDDRGFGGKCLPKDTNALARYAEKKGLNPILLNAVLRKNKKIRGDKK